MAGLLDLIQARRTKRYADGGPVMPGLLAAHAALGQQKAAQDAAVQGGAFSTVPPPLAGIDESKAGQVTPGAVTPASQEVNETGMVPRLLTAGGHDVMGGLDNAMAATAAALGGDALAGRMHAAAAEHAQRGEELTPDQPKSWTKDVTDIPSALKFGASGLVRGLPTIGAMAVGGGLARSAGLPALAGVAAPSLALNTGAAYSEMADQPGVDKQAAGAHALAAGAVSAGLDTLAFGYASKLAPFAKEQLSKLVSSKLTGHVINSLAVEGLTGGAREYVNRVATHELLNNPDIFHLTDEDRAAIEDAAAQNVAATAPLGVAGHFAGRVGGAIDKTIDAAGNLVKRAQPVVAAAKPVVASTMDKAVDLAGRVTEAAQPYVDRAKAGISDMAGRAVNAGHAAMDDLQANQDKPLAERAGIAAANAVGSIRDAARGIIEALTPKPEEGVQKSLSTPMTADQRLLRDSLRSGTPKLSINDSITLSKIFEPLASDGKAFDEALAKPGIADHLATLTGKTPAEFKASVFEALRRAPDNGKETPDKMAQLGELYDSHGISAEDGEHLADLNHSDVLNAVNSPNETGARHPGMSPEMFGSFLSTKRQADAGSKAGGNAWVNVTRTTRDPATGEVKGTETTPKQVNFINLSKAWAPQRELSEKAAMFGERSQQKFDNNFKDGLSAMLNGWHETDEKGNPVDVTVQPARQHEADGKITAVDRADMAGWLRPDSVVGNAGKPRTMADVEASGKATMPVDLPGAIEQYHQKVEADPTVARQASDSVVRMAAEKIKDGLADLEPQRQAEVIQAALDYASDPTQRPIPRDVPSMLRMLPDEVLKHGKARLVSELSDLDTKVVQPRLKTEQETSVDQDMGQHAKSAEAPAPVKEDLAGQHIEYAKPGQEKPVVATASKDEALTNLKRIRAQATTEAGKKLLEQAMNAVVKAPLAASEYAKLANPELKPSDIRGILGVERMRAPIGRAVEEAQSTASPASAENTKPLNVWYGSGENAQLSNLASRPFEANGHQYLSVEHAYQTLKSGEFDQSTYDKYRRAGVKISGQKGTKSEDGWNLKLMKKLIEKSFEQNPTSQRALLATGDHPITHTQDRGVWSTEFPKALMEVRKSLQEGEPAKKA